MHHSKCKEQSQSTGQFTENLKKVYKTKLNNNVKEKGNTMQTRVSSLSLHGIDNIDCSGFTIAGGIIY